MADLKIRLAKVREIENIYSDYIKDEKHRNDKPFDGLRIRAEFEDSDFPTEIKDIPWAFPLLPKTFQSIPKVGEAVIFLLRWQRKTKILYRPIYFTATI